MFLVNGIKYERLGDEHYYAQELFEKEELTGYLKNMFLNTKKSVYEQLVYASGTEAAFADQMEKNDAVRVYAKLPGWFTVFTPLGPYNPDWAVLIDKDGNERLYFVVETKSTLFTEDIRDKESAKIACGKAPPAHLSGWDRPMLMHGLLRPRQHRSVPSCLVLTMFIQTHQIEDTRQQSRNRFNRVAPFKPFKTTASVKERSHAIGDVTCIGYLKQRSDSVCPC